MPFEQLHEYHHYKEALVASGDRTAQYELHVINLLRNSPLGDQVRDSSVPFELKHSADVTQFARLLARQRGLPVDVCSVGALLHDIYVIVHGKYDDHAHRGAPIAMEIVRDLGQFNPDEAKQIERIVYHHSDKHLWSQDSFEEFGKDVDVLDCFLFPGPFGYYLQNKSLAVFVHYLKRAKQVWSSLHIPMDPEFALLDHYGSDWFDLSIPLTAEAMGLLVDVASSLALWHKRLAPPAFCVVPGPGNNLILWTNSINWAVHREFCGSTEGQELGRGETLLQTWLRLSAPQAAPGRGRTEPAASQLVSDFAGEDLASRALLFWPVLNAYEVLRGKRFEKRMAELGIDTDRIGTPTPLSMSRFIFQP